MVGGYDVVPRMTLRGLGHLVCSVEDLIKHSKHTKLNVLCCKKPCGWQPDVAEVDRAEERQADAIKNLHIPRVESDGSKKQGRFGTHLKHRLAKLVSKRGNNSRVQSDDGDREPMMFIPGRILHMEFETSDDKTLVLHYWINFDSSLVYSCRVRCCGSRKARQVNASWKTREEFSAIQVHSSMLLDHEPRSTAHFVNAFCDQVDKDKPGANVEGNGTTEVINLTSLY